MTRFTHRLDLAYDGARFFGFQQQPGKRTVEGVLLAALRPMLPELPRVAVGGRTDRGVHASGQVVSFWSRAPLSAEAVCGAIEREGAGDVVVLEMRAVPRCFHASFSAVARAYTYRVEAPDLDIPVLDAMMATLVGRRCFHAFARRTPPEQTTVRHLMQGRVRPDGLNRARFELLADRFLRRQVRVMVATALREMRAHKMTGGAPPETLLVLSERGDRAATAPPAPADGLYLTSVRY